MSKGNEKKRDEALVERLMRRVLEGMGSVVDRKLGREADTQSGFTTTKLIERMKHLVDERVRTDEEGRRIAPHLFKLKVEWGTHSEAPPEFIKELENEVHAAAIDYINDQRLRTLAPVEVAPSRCRTSGGKSAGATASSAERLRRRENRSDTRSKSASSANPAV